MDENELGMNVGYETDYQKQKSFSITTQENTSLDELLKKADALLKSSNKTLAEGRAMDEAIAFALEQWKTNKRWFREEPGRVTTEDVIKMCIEFAWASKANFEYTYNSEKGE